MNSVHSNSGHRQCLLLILITCPPLGEIIIRTCACNEGADLPGAATNAIKYSAMNELLKQTLVHRSVTVHLFTCSLYPSWDSDGRPDGWMDGLKRGYGILGAATWAVGTQLIINIRLIKCPVHVGVPMKYIWMLMITSVMRIFAAPEVVVWRIHRGIPLFNSDSHDEKCHQKRFAWLRLLSVPGGPRHSVKKRSHRSIKSD